MVSVPITTPETRKKAILDQVSAQFDERMAAWQTPDVAEKVSRFLAKRGRANTPPKIGPSF